MKEGMKEWMNEDLREKGRVWRGRKEEEKR
jgi:hypothetical protein